MQPDAEQKLQEIFRAIFGYQSPHDVTGLRQISEPKWDSLAHVSLVMAVESEFGLTIEASDQLALTSYAAVRLFLDEAGR
jgi:acyl carrier protein